MLVSACILARNEPGIGDCLDSVAPFVDEMLVLAAGSTDRTAELAAAHGARIVDQPWPGSFSSARNAVAAACAGTWVVRLDVDTRLHGSPGRFRAALEATGADRMVCSYRLAAGGTVRPIFVYRPDRWTYQGATFELMVPRTDGPTRLPGWLDATVVSWVEVGRDPAERHAHLARYLEMETAAAAVAIGYLGATACVSAASIVAGALYVGIDDLGSPDDAQRWLDGADARIRATTVDDWPAGVLAQVKGLYTHTFGMLLVARARDHGRKVIGA
jgi:hypothetical protein